MNRIEEMRERAGISRADLAEKISADVSSISKIENGKMRLNQKWLERLSEAIGCTIADLLVSGMPNVSDVAPVATPPRRSSRGLADYIVGSQVLLEAGIEAGSTITVDRTPDAIASRRPGDVLLVRVDASSTDPSAGRLLLRQFMPPALLTTNRNGPFNTTLSLNDRSVPLVVVGILKMGLC